MRTIKIAPSLICMNLLEVGLQIKALNRLADVYHCDVMDNHCAQWFGLPMEFLRQVKSVATVPMDVHLLADDVEGTAAMVLDVGIDMLTLPVEKLATNGFRVIGRAKAAGVRIGVSLNPFTPLESVRHCLPEVEKVTVMMFDPGKPGQSLVIGMLDKIRALIEVRLATGLDFAIEVDGSCNEANFERMLASGADQFVVGTSGLFRLDADIEVAWQKMKAYMDV